MTKCITTSQGFITLARSTKKLQLSDPLTQCLVPRIGRTYATHAQLPSSTVPGSAANSISTEAQATSSTSSPFHTPVLATLHSWPSMQPKAYISYAYNHLNVPLRKDILHRAVIFEADAARQGTASTKHRTQVKGSGRKKVPQKGTGRARQSDLKSPSVRGGGVAHGPHPRDFSTDLPEQIYNLAWRTALSYRYRKGELIISADRLNLAEDQSPRFFDNFFESLGWGKNNGRSLVVLDGPKTDRVHLFEALQQVGEHTNVKYRDEVKVKDLLSCGRVIIERPALASILKQRS